MLGVGQKYEVKDETEKRLGAAEMPESDASYVEKEMIYREKAKGLGMYRGRARREIRNNQKHTQKNQMKTQ